MKLNAWALRAFATAACGLAAIGAGVGCGGGEDGASTGAGGQQASGAIERIQDAGTVRLGIAIALPWTGKDTKTNDYFGPAITLGDAIADELGVKAKYVEQTFQGIIPALQANKVDVIIAPLYETPERLAVVDMTQWSVGGFCYLVKRDSTKIESLDDLNAPDVTLSTSAGTGTYTSVRKKYPDMNIVTQFQTSGESADVLGVRSGRVDTSPFDSPLAKVFESKYPDLKVIPEDCLTNPDIPTPISLAFPKGEAELGKLLARVVEANRSALDAEIEKYSDAQYLDD